MKKFKPTLQGSTWKRGDVLKNTHFDCFWLKWVYKNFQSFQCLYRKDISTFHNFIRNEKNLQESYSSFPITSKKFEKIITLHFKNRDCYLCKIWIFILFKQK